MTAAKPAPRRMGRLCRLLNWGELPTAVRVLVVVLLVGMLVETTRHALPVLDGLGVFSEHLYDALLVGAAVLCVARSALRREERLAWALMGFALSLWAGAGIYWTTMYAHVEEPPYPSLADAGWLGFLPAA